MKVVTGFEDSFSAHAREIPTALEDYQQVYEALKHDLDVAKNVFSRATKKYLKHKLKGHKLILQESSESRTERPLWVSENSVTLQIDVSSQYPAEELMTILSDLADNLINDMTSKLQDPSMSIILIDPIQTAILPVGTFEYSFRIKQKWAYRKEASNG